jgi:hypothetical protein
MSCSPASIPAITRAGSPGITLRIKKIIVETIKMVAMRRAAFFIMKPKV